ncbi:MAG: molybdopterin-dependent oxidoreductase, partial [Acidimicrobiia bacterium]|nr:molybdopterin-dependent oxidoreductase [Acidimicrobiia bacterium]
LFGTSDMGQGARTVFAQVVAEELGIPMERISVISGDTATVPYDQQTSASRSTVLMGNAVLRACGDINGQVARMAARQYGVAEDDVSARGGVVRMTNEEIPADEVIRAALGALGGELSGKGEMRKEVVPGHPLSGTVSFYEFNCTAVEVEVDGETGETRVLRHVSVGDAGKMLNPSQAAGQDEGAAVMGIGHALMEYLILDEAGRVRNLGAVDYRIPTIKDMPDELVSASIENGDGPGPYGSKGISEGSLLCVAPAVAAAIRDATGAVLHDLPMTPERVWAALQK